MNPPEKSPPTPRSSSPLTVQGWQTLVLSIMGALVLGAGIAGGVLLYQYDEVSHELIDEIQPSRSAAYRLQAALRDQETAVRGYAISADRQFLAPYYAGREAEATSASEIEQLAGDRSELTGDLDAIERAADAWRSSFAEPLIASVRPDAPTVINGALADRGKAEFDGIRALFDVQNQHLAEAREAGVANLDDIRWWRNGVLGTIVVVLLATAVALAVVMRSAVTRPLASLAASCRRITEGDFTAKIVPQGPKDIRAIGVDVENMRQRIVAELHSSRSAEEQLDGQAIELRRSNAELEQFAYVASHDLQEPLRKVTAFCQLLEKRYGDKLDERGIEYINFAVDGAKRMQVLINDLLTFSRVGRLNSAMTEVDLDSGLERRARQPGDRDRGVGCRDRPSRRAIAARPRRSHPARDAVAEPDRQCDEVPPGWCRAPHRNRMPTGRGRRTVVVHRHGQRHRHRAGIRRQGVHHLPAPARSRRLRWNGHRSGTVQEDRRASRRHHLDRHVLHRGNPFSLHLARPQAHRRRGRRVHGNPGRNILMTLEARAIDVLLVEDDPGDELITREAFEHNKIKNNLHVAHDGEEGLDFLYRRGAFENAPTPDLILLDLNLPKYDGRQLLEKIKSDPELNHIPVVVLTTSAAEEDILKSYKLHANAYVTKPVDLDQFMNAVRQIDEFFVQVVRLPQG